MARSCNFLEFPLVWVFKCPTPHLGTTSQAWACLMFVLCNIEFRFYAMNISLISTPYLFRSDLWVFDRTATVRLLHPFLCPKTPHPSPRSIPYSRALKLGHRSGDLRNNVRFEYLYRDPTGDYQGLFAGRFVREEVC